MLCIWQNHAWARQQAVFNNQAAIRVGLLLGKLLVWAPWLGSALGWALRLRVTLQAPWYIQMAGICGQTSQ